LVCATRNGGLSADPSGGRGTLVEGALADVLVVDGDPLNDVRVLQEHAKIRVFKGGKEVLN